MESDSTMEEAHQTKSDNPTKSDNRVKGSWRHDEDELLHSLVRLYGPRKWSLISKSIPGRTAKSCRLRWCNQLSPTVKHRPFTPEEDAIIAQSHAELGNKWTTIAKRLDGRSDNAVKNHWNSTLKRKIKKDDLSIIEESRTKRLFHSPVTSGNNCKSPQGSESYSDSHGNLCGFVKICPRSDSSTSKSDEFSRPSTRLTLSPPGSESDRHGEGERTERARSEEKAAAIAPEILSVMQELIRKEVQRFMEVIR